VAYWVLTHLLYNEMHSESVSQFHSQSVSSDSQSVQTVSQSVVWLAGLVGWLVRPRSQRSVSSFHVCMYVCTDATVRNTAFPCILVCRH